MLHTFYRLAGLALILGSAAAALPTLMRLVNAMESIGALIK